MLGMKKVGLFLILLTLTLLPSSAKGNFVNNNINKSDTLVFVYHIPDDDEQETVKDNKTSDKKQQDIISDDVTADTSPDSIDEDTEEEEEEEATEEDNEDEVLEDYQIDDMYSDVLHGYAEYNEEDENAITLDNSDNDKNKLHIKRPVKITSEDYTDLKSNPLKLESYKYSKYKAPEYSISPLSSKNYRQVGGFSAGTIYDQGISYGELEQSSGVFSKYQYKNLGLSLSYVKTVNTTNNNYNDNFYFAPEWRLNQYLTLKEILSADVTKNRQKTELILSINPFGLKDTDRMNLEFGVNQTYYLDDSTTKNQFMFSTNFKL